jgi:HEAT repeat protein
MTMTHEGIRDLASREGPGALGALAEAAAVADQFLRRTAIEAIGRHPQGRELRAIVLGALCDSSEYVVRTACEVVAQWELSEAHEPVAALLTNAPTATRQAAVRAVGAIWLDTDFPLIFSIYADASETELRRDAAWVLRQRVPAAHRKMLFEAFSADELPRHRQWACELAENLSGSEILPILSRLSLDEDGHVRKAASRVKIAP